jgi:flagellar motor component MotA
MKKIDKIYLQTAGTLLPGFALVGLVALMEKSPISHKNGGMIAAMLIGSAAGFWFTRDILKAM